MVFLLSLSVIFIVHYLIYSKLIYINVSIFLIKGLWNVVVNKLAIQSLGRFYYPNPINTIVLLLTDSDTSVDHSIGTA